MLGNLTDKKVIRNKNAIRSTMPTATLTSPFLLLTSRVSSRVRASLIPRITTQIIPIPAIDKITGKRILSIKIAKSLIQATVFQSVILSA